MHWKLRAAIQNAIAALPERASYAAYYRIQRTCGELRHHDPSEHLEAAVELWQRILDAGRSPSGKTFFEVGTGRVPTVPIAYWLMGAGNTITVDRNPYLKAALVGEAINHIAEHSQQVAARFGTLLWEARFKALLQLPRPITLARVLELCSIQYLAPADAAHTSLPPQSVDFHTSYTVLEHIPAGDILEILLEGGRIMRPHGLFVHRIDYTDHFSHSDPAITSINFLQYSDDEWARYSGNRYTYVNRLRHDDYLQLFASAGHTILAATPFIDERARRLLQESSFRVHRRFATKSREVLCISGSWLVTELPHPTQGK